MGGEVRLLAFVGLAVLHEEGAVALGAMRRGAANSKQRAAGDWGQGTTQDQFWLLKLKESVLYDRDGVAGRFSDAGGRLPIRHGVGGSTTKFIHSFIHSS